MINSRKHLDIFAALNSRGKRATMKAVVLTIGDEILLGDTIDTNSAWIGKTLNLLGIDVRKVVSVGDKAAEITSGLDEALQVGNLVLVTGGLGPTKDDITKKTLADYFGTTLILNQELLAMQRAYYESRKRKFLPMHEAMSYMPENAQLLPNELGTAPGMWFEHNGKVIVSMPGVPYEMKSIVTEQVLPKLKETFQLPVIKHRYFMTVGRGETQLADKISDIEEKLPEGFSIAYLPGRGKVKVRLTGKGENKQLVETGLKEIGDEIYKRIEKYTFGEEGAEHVLTIAELMMQKRLTLATAESCTGGSIAQKITAFSGSSRYFEGGTVVYSNKLKMDLLGVDQNTLTAYGAVSEQTVREMVTGTLKRFGVDYAIATSGVAGPTGGTEEKPVGTVWIAVGNAQHTVAKKFNFAKNRAINIELSSVIGLEMLRRLLLGTLKINK